MFVRSNFNILRINYSVIIHPILLFVGIWSLTFYLYSLDISELTLYRASDFIYVYLLITVGFINGYYLVSLAISATSTKNLTSQPIPQSCVGHMRLHTHEIWKRANKIFALWALVSILEIIASGGIPIIWLLIGSDKNYMDFGISSVHGLAHSMILASAMVSFSLYLITNKNKFLVVPIIAITWFIVSITRNYVLGLTLQMVALYILIRRFSPSVFLRITALFVILIVLFGVWGDQRSGSGGDSMIRQIGRPTENYPEWLPSGFFWVYLYITSPLNNLLNTISQVPFSDSYTLASTLSSLIPSVIRNIIFSSETLSQGLLVDGRLNMSGAFLGSYLDFGLLGIVIYSVFIGCVSALFWRFRYRPFYALGYAFVAMALSLTTFFNAMLALPYFFQLIWFWWIFAPIRRLRKYKTPLINSI
jgi:oligosaccharide repeat unit polymerase